MELIECIKRIPSLLDNILLKNEEAYRKISVYLAKKEIDECIFIASGTSMTAASVTKYFAYNKLNIKTTFIHPNVFLNYYNYLNPKGLYIFISQGGATKLVYESLCKVKANHLYHLAMTEKQDSPIAKEADCFIEIGSVQEEFMYRTIGYSCSSATCYLLEMNIARFYQKISEQEYKNYFDDMKQVSSNLDTIRKITTKWYEENKFSLLRRNKCLLAGAGYLFECANEADIKMMEMIPMYARSFELEEFIHGPQNAFSDDTIFFLLNDKQKDSQKVHCIKQFLQHEIGFCSIVGDDVVDDRDLKICYQTEHFRSLEMITCFQVISYLMAKDRGRDLTRGVNSIINQYIKKTL